MVNFPTLATKDLTLRCVKVSDTKSLLVIYGDSETMNYYGNPTKTLSQVEFLIDAKLNAFKSFTGIYFVIVKNSTNEVVGFLDLTYYEYKWQVEFCINRVHRNKGYAKQSLSEVISFCRNNQIKELYSKVKAKNDISCNLLLKLNFSFHGITSFFDNGVSEIGFGYKLVL